MPFAKLTSAKITADNDAWEFTLNSENTVKILKTACTYFKYEADKVQPADATSFDFMTCDLLDCEGNKVKGLTINIDASTFGGTYYITGDTYARNYESGKDEFLQFIIPKGKVSSEDLSLTMEADGDPATFSMNVNVLRANDGSMFKLVKYTMGAESTSEKNKGVASVLTSYDKANDENAGYQTEDQDSGRKAASKPSIDGGSKPSSEA